MILLCRNDILVGLQDFKKPLNDKTFIFYVVLSVNLGLT